MTQKILEEKVQKNFELYSKIFNIFQQMIGYRFPTVCHKLRGRKQTYWQQLTAENFVQKFTFADWRFIPSKI